MTTFGTPPEDPHAPSAQDAQQRSTASGAAGTLSPDGRWRWDGRQWQPVEAPGEPGGGMPQPAVPSPGGGPSGAAPYPGGPYPGGGADAGGPYPGSSPYGPPPGYGQYGQAAMPTIKAGPAPGLAYAGFWIRLLAYLIDSAILFAVVLVLGGVSGGLVRTDPVTGVQTVNGGLQGLAFIIGIAYFIGFWGTRSQTPGMMALNLRIAREEDGGPLDLGRAAIRYVGYVVSGLALCLGFIWVGIDSRKQGWHDKIARTLVVRQY